MTDSHKPRAYRRSDPPHPVQQNSPHVYSYLPLLLAIITLLTVVFLLFGIVLVGHYEETSGTTTAHVTREITPAD